jgi:hypothetical protein
MNLLGHTCLIATENSFALAFSVVVGTVDTFSKDSLAEIKLFFENISTVDIFLAYFLQYLENLIYALFA